MLAQSKRDDRTNKTNKQTNWKVVATAQKEVWPSCLITRRWTTGQ
jgi:hypothetical protein